MIEASLAYPHRSVDTPGRLQGWQLETDDGEHRAGEYLSQLICHERNIHPHQSLGEYESNITRHGVSIVIRYIRGNIEGKPIAEHAMLLRQATDEPNIFCLL